MYTLFFLSRNDPFLLLALENTYPCKNQLKCHLLCKIYLTSLGSWLRTLCLCTITFPAPHTHIHTVQRLQCSQVRRLGNGSRLQFTLAWVYLERPLEKHNYSIIFITLYCNHLFPCILPQSDYTQGKVPSIF